MAVDWSTVESFPCDWPRVIPGLMFPVRCGKCPRCVSAKAYFKRQRIRLEIKDHGGERAWFCTLTFKEAQLDEKAAYPHVQKWLKRLRKALAPDRARYVAVTERGSRNKRLHYHVIVFLTRPMRYRELPKWTEGFSHYKIADSEAWMYISKYLEKDVVKARGSTKMGFHYVLETLRHPLVEELTNTFPGATLVRIDGVGVPTKLSAAVAAHKDLIKIKSESGTQN